MYDMRDKSEMRKFAQRLIKIIVGVVLFLVLAFVARKIYHYIIIDTDLIMPGSPDYKISYYEGYERYNDIDFKVCHTLTEEEQEKLLTAFDVNVPENENDISIYRFGFITYYDEHTGKPDEYKYFIEIDGVKDYFAFYDKNPSENGKLGRSVNELYDCNSQLKPMKRSTRYYLTYDEIVWMDGSKPEDDKGKEVLEKFDPLFQEMWEKRYSAE